MKPPPHSSNELKTRPPVVALERNDVALVSGVLAKAFQDDPMMSFILPDADHRRRALEPFMAPGVRLGLHYGQVDTTPTHQGAAVWLSPGNHHITEDKLQTVGFADVVPHLGNDATARFLSIMEHFASVHDLDCPRPHWYLLILGVEPDAQGQGIGGSLILPILRRADAEGTPCFLNTHKPSNVAFYQRHGFVVVREEAIPGRVPHFWNLRRQLQ